MGAEGWWRYLKREQLQWRCHNKDVCSGGLFMIAEPLCKVVDVSGVA